MKNSKWHKFLSITAISILIMSGFVSIPAVYADSGSGFTVTGKKDYFVGKEDGIHVQVNVSGQDYDEDYAYRVIILDYPVSPLVPETSIKHIVPYGSDCRFSDGNSCEFWLGGYENIATGSHQIGAVIEKSGEGGYFDKEIEDVHTLADVGEIVREVQPSDRYFFWKIHSNPVLGQSSRYFTSDILSESEEQSPQIFTTWNSFSYEDKYYDYIYDVTNDRVIGNQYPINELHTFYFVDETNDDYMQFQIIRAKAIRDYDVLKKSDLEDIQYESNIVEFERRLWSIDEVEASYDGTDRPYVSYTAGGGEDREIYLEDNTTGEIIWSDGGYELDWDDLLDWEKNPNHGHLPVDNIDWATYWVADKWEGDFDDRPRHVSDLKNKITNSRGLKDSIPDSQSGIKNPEQVAGGQNKIEQCISQLCHGDPINSFTGEFFDNATDLRGVGSSMIPDSTRSFSTIRKDELGVMGYGWRNAYEMGLESDGSNLSTDDEIRFVQENGATSYFTKQSDGTYKTSASVNLKLLSDGKFELFNKLDRTTTLFSENGKFEKITDSNGNYLSMAYTDGKVSKALSNNGSYINFTYNASGLLSKATSDTGDTVNYTYNTGKQLISVKNQDGVVFDYTYDAKRRVKTLTNEMGGVTTNTYDTDNRVTRQIDPLGGILRFSYDAYELDATTTITQPNGLKVLNVYQNGYLVSKVEAPDTRRGKENGHILMTDTTT